MSKRRSGDQITTEVLEALRKKGLGNKQGAVAAARAYLEHTIGRAIPKPQAPGLTMTEETARRMATLAERLLQHCPHCGKVLGEPVLRTSEAPAPRPPDAKPPEPEVPVPSLRYKPDGSDPAQVEQRRAGTQLPRL